MDLDADDAVEDWLAPDRVVVYRRGESWAVQTRFEDGPHDALVHLPTEEEAQRLRDALFQGLSDLFADRYEAALPHLLLAAEAGAREAQCNLGTMFQVGMGCEPDVLAAEKWLLRAASQGHAPSAWSLSNLYAAHPDETRWEGDPSSWLAESARLGLPPASG
jgi:TPR repeat protein